MELPIPQFASVFVFCYLVSRRHLGKLSTMHTTYDLCRAVQRRYNFTSAYMLAKKMGVSNKAAQNWVNKKGGFSTANAVKCAELLSLQPAYVVACVNFEKEKEPQAREFWKGLVDKLPEKDSSN